VRGLVVNYGSVSGSLTDLDPIELGEAGSLFLTRPRLADHLADADTVQRRADEVFAALFEGSLTISISARYAFDRIEEAHAELEERRQLGKSVLMIGKRSHSSKPCRLTQPTAKPTKPAHLLGKSPTFCFHRSR
jgi:NADPH2:quinone reductase